MGTLLRTGGRWWCSWLRHCATSQNIAGSIPFRPHYDPGVASASNKTEYQVTPGGVNAAGA